MADQLPCSRCPILDLGTRYPVNDKRDPWRRMPVIFAGALKVLGGGMMAHESRTRENVERRLGHYCRITREKHGPCNGKRIHVCQDALAAGFQAAQHAERPWPFAQACITRLTTDDRHHENLKATRIAPATKDLRMPPITMQRMAEVS